MSTKNDAVYINHILDCIHQIQEYTIGGRKHFFESRLIQDAVVRNLQTLAESSQRLSEKLKETYPSISWREISGFRNILVHGYLGIDRDVVWSVVEMELPHLLKELKKTAL